jgi:hypothetical protein
MRRRAQDLDFLQFLQLSKGHAKQQDVALGAHQSAPACPMRLMLATAASMSSPGSTLMVRLFWA